MKRSHQRIADSINKSHESIFRIGGKKLQDESECQNDFNYVQEQKYQAGKPVSQIVWRLIPALIHNVGLFFIRILITCGENAYFTNMKYKQIISGIIGMENAIEILKKDHLEVKEGFRDYDNIGKGKADKRLEIADKIFSELEMHFDLEEEIFYPAVESAGGEDLIADSLGDHSVTKDIISELRGISPEDEEYDFKFRSLMEGVERHVKKEESSVFPFAEKILQDDLDDLGAQMKSLKNALKK